MHCKRIKGIGLLDILVVVFLLGIVAAIVVPRFMNLHSDAHRANNQGTAAAISAGITLLQSKAQHKGYDRPLTFQMGEEDYVILFTSDGWPQGIGQSRTNYMLFEQSELGDAACKLFFEVIMQGNETSVITRNDYRKNGERADYMAMGFRGRVYDGCRYIYTDAQPEKGKVYVVKYDPNGGNVTVETGDMPR
ncbi:MAG: hypothetical protein CMF48_00535 [Legionellales bacterium]|nr:hypothetical protein [Legionellales bacterium]|tara:strand:+ start:341 stop:916 length:576 start_codon:yes stop_codon:yes gene_type:complete